MPKVRNTRRENHAASMTIEMPLKVSTILNTHDTGRYISYGTHSTDLVREEGPGDLQVVLAVLRLIASLTSPCAYDSKNLVYSVFCLAGALSNSLCLLELNISQLVSS